jgi:hypothetical protein
MAGIDDCLRQARRAAIDAVATCWIFYTSRLGNTQHVRTYAASAPLTIKTTCSARAAVNMTG